MSKIPSIEKRLVPFRGASSSRDYNEFQNNAFYDITELYTSVNEMAAEITRTEAVHSLTSKYQELRIRELEQELYRVSNLLDSYRENTGKYKAFAYVDDFEADLTANDFEQAYLDTYHGIAHLPITGKMISKVYIYDEVANQIVVPNNLQVELSPSYRRNWRIIDNDVKNAFNGDNMSYWHRQIIMPIEEMPHAGVTTELVVTLPESVISNKDVNMMYLHPFPLNGITIEKIEYRIDGEWMLLPGWPIDTERNKPAPFEMAGNLKFCFPSTQMNQVKVTLSQPRYIEENYQRVYHFGLQEFGIFHADYQSEVGRLSVPMTLKGNSASKLITGITPHFKNDTGLSDRSEAKSSLFSFNVYMVDEDDQKHYTKETFPIAVNTEDILIKATLYADPNSGATPALECIELTYQDV